MSAVSVGDVRRVLDEAYPPHLAEKWDAVGLICGDPAAEVKRVAFALDCTQTVAERAVELGADMLVVHHPLLLRGVESVAADTPKGKVVHTLVSNGVALFAAHTNADKARPGVNDKLAELVGINPGRPIVPEPQGVDKWGVHVPVAAAEEVKQALFDAGAGHIGAYSHCSFDIAGTGQFQPEEGADPTEGEIGALHRGEELRVEFVAPAALRSSLLKALHTAHPYEVPAYDITETTGHQDLDNALGLGRVGELPQEMTLREFTQQVANALPETAWGIRAAGDPDRKVRTVAVSSGSGDSFLSAAAKLGVDVYVTSDLRHHPVDEHLRAGGPAVIDTAHWASEFPWTAQARDIVEDALELDTEIISLRTDPWTISAHPKES
ncbi:Nif3-like dinuclear metal center hexameric protein [Corynebacterium tuberculostearicum]|uniref:Nif3-like dinuclear metal center hexameric protein n=1 Tax=Corynebacterium tuberculostearicum TaxID=38304 RepID=UPI002666B290|nr:Nif3-like dinuclear metal center hexameric protein [Corynebacterium tuberculostearicum]WKE50319.1 Nif3-like dinuclear metal center hexameric protein [Corynebacterium tuberculostearicum]